MLLWPKGPDRAFGASSGKGGPQQHFYFVHFFQSKISPKNVIFWAPKINRLVIAFCIISGIFTCSPATPTFLPAKSRGPAPPLAQENVFAIGAPSRQVYIGETLRVNTSEYSHVLAYVRASESARPRAQGSGKARGPNLHTVMKLYIKPKGGARTHARMPTSALSRRPPPTGLWGGLGGRRTVDRNLYIVGTLTMYR